MGVVGVEVVMLLVACKTEDEAEDVTMAEALLGEEVWDEEASFDTTLVVRELEDAMSDTTLVAGELEGAVLEVVDTVIGELADEVEAAVLGLLEMELLRSVL